MRAKKFRRIFLLGCIFPISLLIALVATETGLRTALYVIKSTIPTQLSYAQVSGRLISNFEIKNLYYRDSGSQILIGKLKARWSLAGILQKKITIKDPLLEDAEIFLFPVDKPLEEKQPFVKQDFSLPIEIAIKNGDLNKVSIVHNNERIIFNHIGFNVEATHNKIKIKTLNISSNIGNAHFTGDLSLKPPYDFEINNDIEITVDELNTTAVGSFKGNIDSANFKQKFDKNIQGELNLSAKNLIENFSWEGLIDIQQSALLETLLDTRNPVSAKIQSKGDLTFFTTEGKVSSNLEGDDYELTFSTQTDNLENWILKTLSLHSSRIALFASGYYSGNKGYGINAYWNKFEWQVPDLIQIFSNQGSLQIAGKNTDYNYRINGNLLIPEYLPTSDWRISGRGNGSEIFVDDSSIDIMKGNLKVLLALDWSENLVWTGSIVSRKIDLSYYFPKIHSSIQSEFALFGVHQDGQLSSAGANIVALSGNLNRARLTGRGAISYQDKKLNFDDLNLSAGRNTLSLSGNIHDHSQLELSIDAPELHHIKKDFSGQFTANVSLKDVNNVGILTGKLSLQKFKSDSIKIQNMASQFNVKSKRPWYTLSELEWEDLLLALDDSSITLNSQQISTLRKPINDINLRINKTGNKADLNFNLDAEFGKAKLHYIAEHTGSQWLGDIQVFQYTDPQLGTWLSQKDSKLNIKGNKLTLSSTCLTQTAQILCLQGSWQPQKTTLRGNLKNFSVSSISDFLPSNLFLSTIVKNADIDLVEEQSVWQGKIDITTSNGQITYLLPNGEFLSFSHHEAKLSGNLKDNIITSFLSLPISEGLGELKTKMDLSGKSKLELGTKIKLDNINNFVSVIPELQDTKGQLDINFKIIDLIKKPKFSGNLQFTQGSTKIPRLGLKLSDVSLNTNTLENGDLQLSGSAKSDKGLLKIDTIIHPYFDENWNLSGKVEGKNFLAANMPEYRVLASPKIRFKLQQNSIDLNGNIRIPEANLNPRDLSTATVISTDEIVVSKDKNTEKSKPFIVNSKLRVEFGDKVRFEGFGLKCRLEGKLQITDQQNSPTLANGEIRIIEGKYKAYSQNFEIQTGKLLYAGGPVNNPAIHLTAFRQINEIKVGIQVRGTLIKPKLKLVSEPVMDETDILAYLIFERPIGQIKSEEQGKDLQKLALEVIGNEFLATKIGKKLGLEDIRLESSKSTNPETELNQDISLVVGKYLSPKLYVSYGVGLIEHAQSLNIRYHITKKLSFEASKGAEAGGDFIFTIERDKN